MSVSSSQSASAYGLGQLQRQAVLRNAERLESEAGTLAAAASQARKVADDATRRADQLEIDAGGARTRATTARQAATTSSGIIKLGQKIAEQADRIYQSLQSANGLYDRSGRNSASSSYRAGSIFRLEG